MFPFHRNDIATRDNPFARIKSDFISIEQHAGISSTASNEMSVMPLLGPQPPFYEDYRPLEPSDHDKRIFAPTAYPQVRHAQLVPIVHIEALNLASWFPVCWQISNASSTLVVLRTLLRDGSRQPLGSPEVAASLPLALRAYPFVVGTDDTSEVHFLESAIPDQPSDIGAPIMTPAGKAAPGTTLKLQALSAFNHALPLTRAMSTHLEREELLQPWPLEFEIDGEVIAVRNLFIVRPDKFSRPAIFQFIETYGAAAASFLGAHRISLFRAGVLVQTATSPSARDALVN